MAIIIIVMIGIVMIMKQGDRCGHDGSGEGGATDRDEELEIKAYVQTSHN